MAAVAALNALFSRGGSIAFLAGVMDMGADITARLPLSSPVLAGVALFVVVTVPNAALAVAAWRGSVRTDDLAIGVGAILVGWIVVQYAFIRTFSAFQPTYIAIGIAFIVVGWRGRAPRSSSR